MTLKPIQILDLAVGQPLPWDLFDQSHKPILARGYVLKTADELKKLCESAIFREATTPAEKIQPKDEKLPAFNFEDMQLTVGDKLQFKLSSNIRSSHDSTSHGNYFFIATIIGYIKNETLIITMPKTDQLIGEPLLEGDQILVRLFGGQCAFSFTTFIDKIIKLPFKYIHLSFPKHIIGQTIRKSRRIKCQIDATINKNATPVVITNLSTTGAELSSETDLGEPGVAIELSFNVPMHDKESVLRLHAVIRSVKQASKNKPDARYIGLEFTELQSEQVFLLRSFIHQELVEHPNHIVK